jgi:hypothetical protein
VICGEQTTVKRAGAWGAAATRLCKTWACETCAPINKRRVQRTIRAGHPNRTLTLTIRSHETQTPLSVRRELSRCIALLMLYVRRHLDPAIQYFVVIEAHKSGFPHAHLAIRSKYLPQHLLAAEWRRLTGGSFIVDIREVGKSQAAVNYVTKYLGKDLHAYASTKRYWCSRAWIADPADRPVKDLRFKGGWENERLPFDAYVNEWWPLPGFFVNRSQTFCAFGLDSS